MTTAPAGPPGFPKGQWTVDYIHSVVQFSVRHNGISTFRGSFKNFEVILDMNEVAPEKAKLEARIEAASLYTGVSRMEEEVRSPTFLDVARFSHIVFKSRRTETLGEKNYRMIGDLTIRDITREVPLHVVMTDKVLDARNNHRIGFSAVTTINRKEFGTTWDNRLPLGIPAASDHVNIHLEGELVRPVDA